MMGKQVNIQAAADSGGMHPDELMSDVSKSTLSKTLPISLAVHLIVIALTSVFFVYECVQYQSFYPKAKKRQLAEAEELLEKDRKRSEYIKKLAVKEKERKEIAKQAATQPASGRKAMEDKLTKTIVPTQPVEHTIDIGNMDPDE